MKKLLSLLLVLTLAFSLAACGTTGTPEGTAASTAAPEVDLTDAPSDVTVLGEGDTAFSFTVVDAEGTKTAFEIHTDAATVGEALIALGLIEGHETEYGLYVDAVNGIALDWEKDGKYWAFYIDGEYAMTGVDATEVTPGAVYTFQAE